MLCALVSALFCYSCLLHFCSNCCLVVLGIQKPKSTPCQTLYIEFKAFEKPSKGLCSYILQICSSWVDNELYFPTFLRKNEVSKNMIVPSVRYYEILLDIYIYVIGLAHTFLFLYKRNPMCSIYTKNLSYSFFSFNMVSKA